MWLCEGRGLANELRPRKPRREGALTTRSITTPKLRRQPGHAHGPPRSARGPAALGLTRHSPASLCGCYCGGPTVRSLHSRSPCRRDVSRLPVKKIKHLCTHALRRREMAACPRSLALTREHRLGLPRGRAAVGPPAGRARVSGPCSECARGLCVLRWGAVPSVSSRGVQRHSAESSGLWSGVRDDTVDTELRPLGLPGSCCWCTWAPEPPPPSPSVPQGRAAASRARGGRQLGPFIHVRLGPPESGRPGADLRRGVSDGAARGGPRR